MIFVDLQNIFLTLFHMDSGNHTKPLMEFFREPVAVASFVTKMRLLTGQDLDIWSWLPLK